MKKLLFTVFLFVSVPLLADEIYLMDGTVVMGKITQIDVKFVEYTSSKTGATETVDKDLVKKVKYDNGEVIIMNDKSKKPRQEKDVFAEDTVDKGNTDFFVGFGIGWNGYSATGIRLEVPIGEYLSLNAGFGYGLWRYRISGFGKFYFGHGPYGLAAGFGVAYNTGDSNYKSDVADSFDTVTFNLKPLISYIGTLSYSWETRSGNKWYLEVGYAYAPHIRYTYVKESGGTLSSSGKSWVEETLANNGWAISAGFMF